MDKVRELDRVAQEEDMSVVGDDVPVTLIGLQLVSETRQMNASLDAMNTTYHASHALCRQGLTCR